ncbi:unnamed protein product [Linum trigynum]|uniref:Uncharacterized protein n=1 Tax=Linum trigynum TaxID=586398 RepID=A0AAV2GL01_9ROSI
MSNLKNPYSLVLGITSDPPSPLYTSPDWLAITTPPISEYSLPPTSPSPVVTAAPPTSATPRRHYRSPRCYILTTKSAPTTAGQAVSSPCRTKSTGYFLSHEAFYKSGSSS